LSFRSKVNTFFRGIPCDALPPASHGAIGKRGPFHGLQLWTSECQKTALSVVYEKMATEADDRFGEEIRLVRNKELKPL